MRRLRTAALAIWSFVVGDDWRIAVGVIASLGLTALLAEVSPAWFVMPAAVGCLLVVSVWLAAKRA